MNKFKINIFKNKREKREILFTSSHQHDVDFVFLVKKRYMQFLLNIRLSAFYVHDKMLTPFELFMCVRNF